MAEIADFIDRDEFMRLIQEAYQAAAEKAGTYCKDIVRVVRCKDCIHYHGGEYCENDTYVKPDGYCHWGERREDNAED